MIQAKLAGRKTQTRRIIKESFNGCLTNGGPHPCPNEPVVIYPGETYESPCNPGETIFIDSLEVRAVFHCSTLDAVAKCPYGKVGDILWVRETWCRDLDVDGGFLYRATEPEAQGLDGESPWKPSIHMPKEAARIWERITDIRVERLQDISEADAIAEGIISYPEGPNLFCNYLKDDICSTAKESYQTLWESINGPGSWDLNPFCWVIQTEVLSTTGRPSELVKPYAFTVI